MQNATAGHTAESLLQAFVHTDYVVDLDGEHLVVHIGESQPELDARCRPDGWTIITARNPAARPLDEADNRLRDAELKRQVQLSGLMLWPAVNRDPKGQWPDEPGWCIAGLPKTQAIALAREFGQLGFVRGRQGGPAELWLVDGQWPSPLPDHVARTAA